jgi:dGTPase
MVSERIGLGREKRAVFAADPWSSRGRLHNEPGSPTRTEFQRDRDRIVHSTGFRRLREKTQVFLADEGDHYRTRLTHTIEVAQIARALARALRLDEDLAEALALAHDLGHPPFGHAGERALDRAMAGQGGFDHNAQSLRVVTTLENRYPRFDGLNLTWETLEGLVKHNGPVTDAEGRPGGRFAGGSLPFGISDHAAKQDLWLWSHAAAEAQVAAIADDIAYDAHDVDDGLRAGLFDLEAFSSVGFVAQTLDAIERDYPGLRGAKRGYELVRRLITRMIEDVIDAAFRRIDRLAPAHADDIRRAQTPVIAFSAAMETADSEIKSFLTGNLYRHRRVMGVMEKAEEVVVALFDRYWSDPTALPEEWRLPANAGEAARARRIADFLAGMTDRYALGEYERLFGRKAALS